MIIKIYEDFYPLKTKHYYKSIFVFLPISCMNCCWLMPPKMFCKSWSPIQNKIHKKYDISTWDMVCIAVRIKCPHQNFSKTFQFTFIYCINCKLYYCLKFEQYECYFQWIHRKKHYLEYDSIHTKSAELRGESRTQTTPSARPWGRGVIQTVIHLLTKLIIFVTLRFLEKK